MQYIEAEWHHQNEAYPSRILSELDSEGYETRKLEFYANGKVGSASENLETMGTVLGEKPLPTLDEINSDPEFSAKYISATEFESQWREFVINT